jgi:hypothetical protein
VLEARGDQRLAKEPHLADMASCQQLLDRDVAAELDIMGARHAAEAAAAVLAEDLIARGVATQGIGAGRKDRARGVRGLTRARRVTRRWRRRSSRGRCSGGG